MERRAARARHRRRRHRRHHRLRIAYIWSSEEAASVAGARERALATAEDALIRIRNGLGGRYYKTQKQVDDRAAKIIGHCIADLLTVTTGVDDDHDKPTIAWHRNPDAITSTSTLDGLALAANLPDPPDRTLTALNVLDVYKDQWIVEQRHRDLKQTLHVRPIFLHNDDRIQALIAVVGIALLVYGLIEADLRNRSGPRHPTARHPPRAPRRRPHRPAVGSSSTASPPSNDSSSPTSASPHHGPKHTAPQQHPNPQTLTPTRETRLDGQG